jgi:probable F420-dependent oxidoreductase
MRPLEFGFSVFPFTRFASVREIVDVAQAGEALGYDSIGIPEHLLPPLWPTADPATKTWHDPLTLAAYLAGATKRIKFITGVLVVPYYHPVRLAKAVATLDVVSGGRLMLGVGSGWMKAEFRRLGIPFEERGAITDEYLRAMVELWTSDAPAFRGKYVSFQDVSFEPKPVQRPHVPLLIGGTGRRPFQRAAEIGQGWLPMTGTLEDVEAGVCEIRERMQRLGRDVAELWVGYTGFSMGSGEDRLLSDMRQHAGGAISGVRAATPEEAIREIERHRAAGVTHLSPGLSWQTAGELMAGLEFFAREVMPAFR